MSTRGNLIFPCLATLYALDLEAMEQATDHRYGDVPDRIEVDEPVRVRVQVERGTLLATGGQVLRPTGDDPVDEIRLVLHYQDLEEAGLVDDRGAPLVGKGYRLAVLHTLDEELIREYPGPSDRKAYVCIEDDDGSFGLTGGYRNLLKLRFATRDASTQRVS